MRLGNALCAFCLFYIASSGRIEYCGTQICGNTDAHTFCKFQEGPGARCVGYIDGSLSVEEQRRVVARLNRRRSDAASGRLRGMPSAGNMLKLRWIEELAKEAQLWADQCRPPTHPEERDECRDLYAISVGQCVASVVGEAPGLRVESMVDMWYMQSLQYKGNVTSYVPPENGRQFYGDFGQILWAGSFMVGCGRSKFMMPWQGRLQSVVRLVCNVSPAGPPTRRALWAPAAPASACPPRSRPDLTLPALCDYQFELNESDIKDNTMTMEQHVLLDSVLEIERNESLYGLRSLDEQYFTNLAKVTMGSLKASVNLYNSSQKLDDGKIDVANGIVKVRDTQNTVKTLPKKADNISLKITNYRIRTVGRPKAYNIEELTEIGGANMEDSKTDHEVIGEVPMNDIYAYYDTGTQDSEIFVTEVPKVESKTNDNIDDKIGQTTTYGNASMTDDLSSTDILTDATKFRIELNMNVDNTTLSEILPLKDVDDYLNDPETVRRLQYALDRMERDMLNSKITSKVRRELRDFPLKPIEAASDKNGLSLSHQVHRNTTVDKDKGPMLNMVLKYMPYLKDYESEILGNGSSSFRVSFGIISYALILHLLSF